MEFCIVQKHREEKIKVNEIIEKMLSRHAIRRFQNRQLEENILEEILTAGLYAPQCGE